MAVVSQYLETAHMSVAFLLSEDGFLHGAETFEATRRHFEDQQLDLSFYRYFHEPVVIGWCLMAFANQL